ncbi:MAG: bifunctional 4-hydroxy-2-oxoglutarate aldolase/2-dehydro-3-deoxy-phosphogluconate aldolase, partial [Ekhidna sp.]
LITAERYGAGLLKVFPADVLGPQFIKGALGPCSHLKLMPTGGVSPNKENLKSWFDAGVVCVGMGSQLVSKEVIKEKDFDSLAQLVKHTFKLIEEIKS